ncbi:kinase-like protein [Corynespora cassiicola Philippines]|uniref:non-specific serine/threonine protein kinase n=1 Tax=Corynespora cassiicola Philippines TaxID=1448308 RepID=A0A2T2P4K0_CORCC|nr:kinase-like protein [Corynespora cassiicola Philippines]
MLRFFYCSSKTDRRPANCQWVRDDTELSAPSLQMNPAAAFPKDHILVKRLGKGSEGVVDTWVNKKSGVVIAVKITQSQGLEMPREVQVLKDLPQHPSILCLLACYPKSPRPDLHSAIFDYCQVGDLWELRENLIRVLTQDSQKRDIMESFLWAIYSQLASAIAYLHEGISDSNPGGVNTWKTIVHRDIKCENIFIANLGTRDDHSNLKIKLGDFGLYAVYDGKNNIMPSYWGTKVCWPPEQTITRMATPASDVWATGCVIHELALQPPQRNTADSIPDCRTRHTSRSGKLLTTGL